MLSNEKKSELIEEILNSRSFQRATTSSALLRYLLKANIEGTYLKEGIIDIDFFGKTGSSDKSNTRVRVSVYNLRKKLNDYYHHEGKHAQWQVRIEKGQYALSFEKLKKEGGLLSHLEFNQILAYVFAFTAFLFLIIQSIPKTKPEIWKPFWTNGKPTTLFVGDSFGFKGTTITGNQGWIRDYKINSLDEYYALLEQQPKLKNITEPSNYHYTTIMGVHAAHDLTRLFSHFNKDLNIRSATTSSFPEIKEGNMIYAGMIKNQNKFLSLFNDTNPYFFIQNNRLTFTGHSQFPKKTLNYFSGGAFSDIAIVSRVRGPRNTEFFFFISAHDMGVIATTDYFSNVDSVRAFEKRYLNEQSNFTAVYRARGYERTNMSLETLMVVPF